MSSYINLSKGKTLGAFRQWFKEGGNPTMIMNQMERVFQIPALNSPRYNNSHPDVIRLYREVSNSRFI